MSSKTEKPTPRRLKEARQKGQFARSRILTSALSTLGASLGLVASVGTLRTGLGRLCADLFSSPVPQVAQAGTCAFRLLLGTLVPVLGGAFFGALIPATLMAGWHLEPSQVAPKLERLNPAEGIKKLFSSGALLDVGKGLGVMILVVFVSLKTASAALPALLRASSFAEPLRALPAFRPLLEGAWKGLAVLVVLGGLDFLLARFRHLKGLQMSRDEVRREHKESEGDPHVKGRRRALHRQLVAGGPARGVGRAQVVVVNPTHLAVALRYDAAECEAPYLTEKARDLAAQQLKHEARRLGIPIIKDVPLARSLIHFEVGEEIPEELYRAAAVVLKVALSKQEVA